MTWCKYRWILTCDTFFVSIFATLVLQMHHNRGSDVDVVHFLDFVAAGSVGWPPQTGRSDLRGSCQHLDLIRNHKRRIESHTKLADYIRWVFRRGAVVFQLVEKLFRSRPGNRSQVIDELLFCHSNSGILLNKSRTFSHFELGKNNCARKINLPESIEWKLVCLSPNEFLAADLFVHSCFAGHQLCGWCSGIFPEHRSHLISIHARKPRFPNTMTGPQYPAAFVFLL